LRVDGFLRNRTAESGALRESWTGFFCRPRRFVPYRSAWAEDSHLPDSGREQAGFWQDLRFHAGTIRLCRRGGTIIMRKTDSVGEYLKLRRPNSSSRQLKWWSWPPSHCSKSPSNFSRTSSRSGLEIRNLFGHGCAPLDEGGFGDANRFRDLAIGDAGASVFRGEPENQRRNR
jgi:hypothetical protein